MNIQTNIKPARLAGYFKIEKRLSSGERIVVRDWFPNLILNNGLDMVGGVRTSTSPRNGCCVGSGNTPPAPNQTQLATWVANANSSSEVSFGAQSSAPYYGWRRTQYTFNAGVAAGTLSEVGVGRTPTDLFSRALIVDGSGNPTTITVLSDEVLYVTYELRMYPYLDDIEIEEEIDGVPTDIIIRASNVTSSSNADWLVASSSQYFVGSGTSDARIYNGDIGTITQRPSGTSAPAPSNPVTNSYTPGSYECTMTATWGLNSGNLAGGIRSYVANICKLGAYQFQFDPPINKTADRTFTITTGISWDRYAP